MINTIEILIALFLFFDIYLRKTDKARKNTSKIEHRIFSLKDGTKIMAFFYLKYEIMDMKNFPDEKQLINFSIFGISLVLGRKDNYKKLDKGDVGKKASKIAEEEGKREDPKKKIIGDISITILKIRKATIEEIEKEKQP